MLSVNEGLTFVSWNILTNKTVEIMMDGINHGWGMGYGWGWIIGLVVLAVVVFLILKFVNQNRNSR
jgi:hypothetical protein